MDVGESRENRAESESDAEIRVISRKSERTEPGRVPRTQ